MNLTPVTISTALLTLTLAACSTQPTPIPPTGQAGGTAGLPILVDKDTENPNGIFFGIFRERDDHAKIPDEVARDLRFKPASVMWYTSWKGQPAFPKTEVLALAQQGVVPHLTWEPWDASLGINDPNQIKLNDILNGK